jgi:hypothetical protein
MPASCTHFANLFPNNQWVCVPWGPGGSATAFGSDDDPDQIFNLSIQRGRVLYEMPARNWINAAYTSLFQNYEFVAVPRQGQPFGTNANPNPFPNGFRQEGFVLYEA